MGFCLALFRRAQIRMIEEWLAGRPTSLDRYGGARAESCGDSTAKPSSSLTELKTSRAANTVEPFKAACLVRSSWKEVRNEP